MSGTTGTSTGTIRGFNQISLGQNNTTESVAPSNYSLTDLLNRVAAIKTNFDPNYLEDIIIRILSHVQDTSNPHQVTLAETGADILQLVYQEWLTLGNTGTITDFYNIFFQLVPIVSATDINSAQPTSLISVSGVQQLVANHNADPSAHSALLDMLLPGNPPGTMPAYALDASFGTIPALTAIRTTPLVVINGDGTLSTVPANTVAIDYETGSAAYSIFGPRTNTLYPSDPTGNTNQILLGASPSIITPIAGGKTIAPDGNAYLSLTESSNNEIHGYSIPISIVSGTEYVSSLFIYPSTIGSFGGLTLYVDGYPNLTMLVDLTSMAVTTGDPSVTGYAHQLPNGWIRLGLQYVAPITATVTLTVAKTNTVTIGSPIAYLGTARFLFGIFGLQHVVGCGMSSYIPTSTGSVSVDGTVLNFNIALYNATTAMFTIAYDRSFTTTGATQKLLTIANATTNPIINIFVVAANLAAQITNLDSSKTTLQSIDGTNSDNITAISVSPTAYSLKCTSNARVDQATTQGALLAVGSTTITLGDNTNPFDGIVYNFTYYPEADNGSNLEFLVGEA